MSDIFEKIYADYGSINNDYNISNYKYGEISPGTGLPKLIDIGTLTNDEYSQNTFKLIQKWKTPDTAAMCLQNAQKIINDIVWNDETQIRNGTIKSTMGLNIIQISADNYDNDDLTFFANNKSVSSLTNALMTINAGNAVDIFGYFVPDVTGTWTFTIPRADINNRIFCKLWVSDQNALYDHIPENADINNGISKNGDSVTFHIPLTKGDVVPIRIHIVTQKITLSNISVLTLTKPDGATNIIPSNAPIPPYFITLINNGELYLKKTLYVGLLQNQPNNLFSCYFMDPSDPGNFLSIYNLKSNPKLQHIKTEINTAVSYDGSGKYSQSNGSTTNIELPPGIPITVTAATYGTSNPYNYTTYNTVDKVTPVTVGPGQTTNVIGDQTINKYTTGYIGSVTTKEQSAVQNSESQQIDVTNTAKNITNQNQLQIQGSQYDSKLGNPIKDGKSTAQFTAKYSYSQAVTDVTDKQIFIDSKTGDLVIGYKYHDSPNQTKMTLDSGVAPQWGDATKQCNYTIVLTNNGVLQVQDGNGGVVGSKDLTKYVNAKWKFNLKSCLPNPTWLQNPLNTNKIPAGKKMPQDINDLTSSDGRFKLMFSNGSLIFDYCALPYNTSENGYKYTTNFNLDNGQQIYYLYRIQSRGQDGRKFMMNYRKEGSTAYYLPNGNTNVLKSAGYTTPISSNVFPYMNPDNSAPTYNIFPNINLQDCKSKCDSDTTCEHVFLTSDTTGKTTCYADNTSNANPLYFSSSTTGSTINKSNYYKKQYTMNTSCGQVENNQSLLTSKSNIDISNINGNITDFRQVGINYSPSQNAQNLTYYCALPSYQQTNANVLQNIKITETFGPGANSVGSEGFHGSIIEGATGGINATQTINAIITPAANQYTSLQTQIDGEYNKKVDLIAQNQNMTSAMSNPKYKYNGSDSIIPNMYINKPNEITPEISLDDGMKRDTQILLLEQNRMYTLASITAVSFLILAVFLARE